MIRSIAAACTLTLACSAPDTYTAEQAVAEAQQRWYDATGVQPPEVVLWSQQGPVPCKGTTAEGCYSYDSKILKLREDLPEDSLRAVALHEVGHSMGCPHNPELGHVMSLFVVQGACLTEQDVASACLANDCLWQKAEEKVPPGGCR